MSSSAIRTKRYGRNKDSESMYSQSPLGGPSAITITPQTKPSRSKRGAYNDPVINVKLSDNYQMQSSPYQSGAVTFAMPVQRGRGKKQNPEYYYDDERNEEYGDGQSDENYSHESDFQPIRGIR